MVRSEDGFGGYIFRRGWTPTCLYKKINPPFNVGDYVMLADIQDRSYMPVLDYSLMNLLVPVRLYHQWCNIHH